MLFDAEAAHAKPPNAPPAAHPWPRDPGSCSSPCRLLGSWENLARCPRDFDKMSERCPDKLQRDSRWPCPFSLPKGSARGNSPLARCSSPGAASAASAADVTASCWCCPLPFLPRRSPVDDGRHAGRVSQRAPSS